MSFLKKLGQVLNAASGLIPVFGPLIAVAIPKSAPTIQNINDELPKIAEVIVQVEAIGQAMNIPGAKKLEVAAPLVAQIVYQSQLLAGKKIKDQAMFMKGVTEVAGGVADILNSLDDTGVSIVNT